MIIPEIGSYKPGISVWYEFIRSLSPDNYRLDYILPVYQMLKEGMLAHMFGTETEFLFNVASARLGGKIRPRQLR